MNLLRKKKKKCVKIKYDVTWAIFSLNVIQRSNPFIRAVVKSTFVESKTSPRPGLSSPSQDRVQVKSKSKRFESKSSPSPNETVKMEKE